jgi:hypothetical protein
MGIVYVTKSTLLGLKGEIPPNVVLRNTNAFTNIGVETSAMNDTIASWEKGGHIILCDESQLLDVIRGKKIMPSVGFGNTAGLDGSDASGFKGEKDNQLHTNDPTDKFGWDPQFLEHKDQRSLQDMVKQVMPEIPEIEVRKIERVKAIDILSARHPSRLNPHA